MAKNEIVFRGIYGRQTFGSGGAWGGVVAVNASTEVGDNGFCSGPSRARIENPRLPGAVFCLGGDEIGDRPRYFAEVYFWDVKSQEWTMRAPDTGFLYKLLEEIPKEKGRLALRALAHTGHIE